MCASTRACVRVCGVRACLCVRAFVLNTFVRTSTQPQLVHQYRLNYVLTITLGQTDGGEAPTSTRPAPPQHPPGQGTAPGDPLGGG